MRRQGEAARAERATAELLDAAQGLHDAHVRLAAANVVCYFLSTHMLCPVPAGSGGA